jgi:lipopolysaccharide transport system ATP-binding protein
MSDIAVKVENLSKLYRIGAKQEQYATLRSALVSGIKGLTTRRSTQQIEENNLWALKDVSFDIKQGEVVGIIGRNGAGKSTLLKVLAHITEPTSGRVSIYGRVGSLLEVGTGFHPELTGRDNIYLNGAILGMKRAEIQRKFDEIVAFAEIEKFLDTPVKRYSSGMYVRLAFAVAAHMEPEILVVDEVLAVGDAEFQKKCLGKMSEVAGKGRTVLFVSHNMAAVRNLCLSAILLQEGALTFSGKTVDVIDKYIQGNFSESFLSIRKYEHAPEQKMFIDTVYMAGEDGKPTYQLRHDQANGLVIEYGVNIPVPGSYLCAEFRNSEDVPVFWVSDAQTEIFHNRKPGKYRAHFHIPQNFFPANHYFIHIAIFSPGKSVAEHAIYNAHDFEIVDETSLLASKGIRFPAVVSLPVRVETDFVSD